MFLRSYISLRSPLLSSLSTLPSVSARAMSATAARPDPFRPAKRVAGQRQDVWYAATRYKLGGKY